jgi:hypothetical protein
VDSVSQTNHIWWRNIDYPENSQNFENYFFDIENCVLLKTIDFSGNYGPGGDDPPAARDGASPQPKPRSPTLEKN